MNITLTPDSERYLREQLAAGRFPSPDVAISEALRRMREYDHKMDGLRRDIAVGIEQADQGRATEFNEATLECVKSKAGQQGQAAPTSPAAIGPLTPSELRKRPRAERQAILAAVAVLAEPDYRDDKQLTSFDALSEEELDDDESVSR